MRRWQRDGDHRLLGAIVLVFAAVCTWLSIVAIDGGPLETARTARIVLPAGGPIVKDGDDVRLSGVRIGQVRRIELTERGAEATLTLGDTTLRRDATARVQLRGLAGAVNVDLRQGTAEEELGDGELLGAAESGTQVSEVVAGFDADTRRALAGTIQPLGTGLAGRGTEVNRLLGDLTPALEDLTPLMEAMRPGVGDLVVQAQRVAAAVPADLDPLVRAASATFATTGARAAQVRSTLAGAPGLEAQVARTAPAADALLDDLRPTLTALRPGIRSLTAALPDLRAIEARTGALSRLAAVGRAATPVLRSAAPVVEAIYPSAASLVASAPPFGTLATYLAPYGEELVEAPAGFTRWGDFAYGDGQASGARAVRFSMIFTCAKKRDPYPDPGEARGQRERCVG